MVAEVQLSDADKRQIVYSSLLKFSPETTSLRDRALDRLILGALVGSTEDNAFQIAHILGNIQVSRNGPRLREEVVREGLDRLMEAGKASKTEKKKRRHFYLSELGRAETSEAVTSADQLFEQALREMLKNTEHHFTFAVGAAIARKVVLYVFARFGRDLAKTVTNGGYDHPIDRGQISSITCWCIQGICRKDRQASIHRVHFALAKSRSDGKSFSRDCIC